jgi:hypothetical protein
MAGPADGYRLKAADMLAKAEENDLLREEFENLAKGFLRLADQADRNAQLGLPLEPDDLVAYPKQQASGTLAQQQQQQQQQQEQQQPKHNGTE